MMESTRSTGQEDRVLLAMVSQYTDKYFWNEELGPLPEEIRKEVLVLLIMITEEAGGITVMGFEEDGEIYLASTCEEGDLGYDEISAGLLIREVEREQKDMLERLSEWYRKVGRKRQ